MTPRTLARQIQVFCRAHEDARQVAKYARYFREGFDAYGVPPGELIRQKEAWLTRHRDALGLDGFLALGDLLVTRPKFEEGSLAILFAAAFIDEFTPAAFDRTGAWLDHGLRNWAHTDVLCGEILSPCLRRGIVRYTRMAPWRRSESTWKRRATAVALIPLLKDGIEPKRLLPFVRPLMLDEAREVHQGVGWFLRETWKRDRATVEAFLLEWKERAPRLIFQYATEKMSPAGKARFRRTTTGKPSR